MAAGILQCFEVEKNFEKNFKKVLTKAKSCDIIDKRSQKEGAELKLDN